MGDVSIIARRLENGDVEYGWSGNGGYCKNVGFRLLSWYVNKDDVDYLFSLGQTRLIGRKGSEFGGYPMIESHFPTGEAFDRGSSERYIFSRIAVIDFGYFYDMDERWYYVVPGPFRIKIPLDMVVKNLDEENFEQAFIQNVEKEIITFICMGYRMRDEKFAGLVEDDGVPVEQIIRDAESSRWPITEFYDRHRKLFDYFDDWVLIKSNKDGTEISEIVLKPKKEKHIETIYW